MVTLAAYKNTIYQKGQIIKASLSVHFAYPYRIGALKFSVL
jgi:hypothetical protein